jgi:hypothetical protein
MNSGFYTAGPIAGSYQLTAQFHDMTATAAITITGDSTAPPPGSPPPPPPPVTGSCLTGTPTITLAGAQRTWDHRASLAPNTRIDARTATWRGEIDYGALAGKGSGLCWSGGAFVGQWPASTSSWDEMHSTGALLIYSPHAVVEDVWVSTYGDGFRFQDLASHWTLRRVHVVGAQDDCVENDRQHSGLIDDSFFEGCFVFLSERPGSSTLIRDSSHDTVTVQNSLVWQKPVPFPEGCRFPTATPPCTGPLWKWDNTGGRGSKVVVKNTIFRIDQPPSNGHLNLPPDVVGCQGNTVVWLGSGPFPARYPACFTITTDKSVWDRAVADWKARRPGR